MTGDFDDRERITEGWLWQPTSKCSLDAAFISSYLKKAVQTVSLSHRGRQLIDVLLFFFFVLVQAK